MSGRLSSKQKLGSIAKKDDLVAWGQKRQYVGVFLTEPEATYHPEYYTVSVFWLDATTGFIADFGYWEHELEVLYRRNENT